MTNNRILLLRVTYWWGIIADAVETVRMVFPNFFIASTGANVRQDPGFNLALMYGAPVMLGWTLILFWADRKPVERRGVLLCLIPVVIAYFFVEVLAVSGGIIPLKNMLPVFIIQPVFLFMIVLSYLKTRTGITLREDQSPR
jgi:hypothetical protein